MKRVVVLFALVGCAKQTPTIPEQSEPVAPSSKPVGVDPPQKIVKSEPEIPEIDEFDGRRATRELEDLEDRAQELLDAIFENDWMLDVEDNSKSEIESSTRELQQQLTEIDRRIQAKLREVHAMRTELPILADKAAHEAAIARQKVTSLETRMKRVDAAMKNYAKAAAAAMEENKTLPAWKDFAEEENAEIRAELREAERESAAMKLELEKARRELRLYD
jgi:hypothetical protein